MKSCKVLAAAWVAATLMAVAGPAGAQSAGKGYPSRTISLVVPYAPAGITDVVTRMLATPLSKELGEQVIVENVTGAGGNIGSQKVAAAAPDGYNLLVSQTSTVTNPLLDKAVKFSATDSFTHVAYIGSLPLWLMVNPSYHPWQGVDALVKQMKAEPGKLNYGSGGTGSASHLGVVFFEGAQDVKAVHVPYRGMSAAITDLLGGSVDFVLTPAAGAESMVKSGKLKALAITGTERLKAFPDVPTFVEAGFPSMKGVAGWIGISAPKNLPPEIVERLNAAIGKVLADPQLQAALLARTVVVKPGSPAEFAEYVRSESDRWGRLIKSTGIKTE